MLQKKQWRRGVEARDASKSFLKLDVINYE